MNALRLYLIRAAVLHATVEALVNHIEFTAVRRAAA